MSTEYNEPGTAIWHRTGFMHEQRYEFAAAQVTGKRVLNVGCGPGYAEAILGRYRPTSITSIDRDAALVARLTKAPPAIDVPLTYQCADASDLPVGIGDFDVIIAFEIIEHLSDPIAFMKSLARATSPTGTRLILSTPNATHYSKHPTRPFQNPYHVHEFEFGELQALAGSCLRDPQFLAQVEREYMDIIPMVEASFRSLNSLWTVRLERKLRKWLKRPLADFYFLPQQTSIRAITPETAASADTFIVTGWL